MKKQSKHSKSTSHNTGRRYANSKNSHKHRKLKSKISKISKVNKINTHNIGVNNTNSTSTVRKINIKKIIIAVIIILIVVFGIVEIEQFFNKTSDTTTNNNYKELKLSDFKPISGLEHIEVTNVYAKMQENTTFIEIKLKNNSDTNQVSFKAHFSIYDKDTNRLFGTQCLVPEIPANSEAVCNIICNDDLSNGNSYEINKIK